MKKRARPQRFTEMTPLRRRDATVNARLCTLLGPERQKVGLSQTFSDINVGSRKRATNSPLRLYAFLLLLPNVRYRFPKCRHTFFGM